MKKHAGKVMTVGIGASVFGLVLMAGTGFASDLLGASAQGAVSAAGEASWNLLMLGIFVLGAGIFMLTRAD